MAPSVKLSEIKARPEVPSAIQEVEAIDHPLGAAVACAAAAAEAEAAAAEAETNEE